MAVHPHFEVEEVKKDISLMLEPLNQPLRVRLQLPSLLNNLLLHEVPPDTIPNIMVFHTNRIFHKPFDIPYVIMFYTSLSDILCW